MASYVWPLIFLNLSKQIRLQHYVFSNLLQKSIILYLTIKIEALKVQAPLFIKKKKGLVYKLFSWILD